MAKPQATDSQLEAMFAEIDSVRTEAPSNIAEVIFAVKDMSMERVQRWIQAHKTGDYDAINALYAELVISAPKSWGKLSEATTYQQLSPMTWKALDERFASVVNYMTSKN